MKLNRCGCGSQAETIQTGITGDTATYYVHCCECPIRTRTDADRAAVEQAWNRAHPVKVWTVEDLMFIRLPEDYDDPNGNKITVATAIRNKIFEIEDLQTLCNYINERRAG